MFHDTDATDDTGNTDDADRAAEAAGELSDGRSLPPSARVQKVAVDIVPDERGYYAFCGRRYLPTIEALDCVSADVDSLLVLDPFVRLHRVNENSADDVAPLLAYLRELQRTYDVAVLLVHHARKGGHARAGQALRGSSEFHAWGDSNLYLRRDRDRLRLTIEHRAAGSLPTMTIALASQDDGLALQLQDAEKQPEAEPAGPSHEQRVLEILESAEAPMTRRALRDACRMRSQALGDALESLVGAGRVVRGSDGFLRT